MTISILDNGNLFIESDLIEEYLDNSPDPGFTLNLTTTLNCSEKNISTALNITNLTVNDPVGYNFGLPSEGVYYFVLQKTEGTIITKETLCYSYLTQTTLCQIVDHLANKCSDVYKYYEALSFINDCPKCICDSGCKLYNKLTEILNSTDNGCGCN